MIEIDYRLKGQASFSTRSFDTVAAFLEGISDNPSVFRATKGRVLKRSDFYQIKVRRRTKPKGE